MARKILTLVIFFTIGIIHLSFAQEDEKKESENHIYLKTGDYVYGESIKINSSDRAEGCNFLPFTQPVKSYVRINDKKFKIYQNRDNYINIDGKKYNFSKVRFIMLDSAYLAVVEDIARNNDIHLSQKFIDGNINVYLTKLTEIESNAIYRQNYYFYNRGKQKVKQLRYKNIKDEYEEGSESMMYLEKHRRLQIMEYAISGVTLTYLGINGVSFFKFLFSDPDFDDKIDLIVNPTNSNFLNLASNVIINFAPYYLYKIIAGDKKEEYLLHSVKAYNYNKED